MSGEFQFIDALRGLATHPAARGLLDDAAVLQVGPETLVLTQDSMVEGVHYLANQDMADVAWKLVAANLSDLAAKGAAPLGILYAHTLGLGDDRLIHGLTEVLSAFDVPLLGGDTVSGGPPRCLSVTAIGRATCTPVPSRSGAQVGNAVYLTGPVGGSMMGFLALRDRSDADSSAYRRPQPLLGQGMALAPLVSAMMDVSDGLLLDASRIASASGVTIALESAAVPISAPENMRDRAMRWGDDYQLLFTGPPRTAWPIPVNQIGRVLPCGKAPLMLDGRPPDDSQPLGYEHDHSD